MIKFTTGGNQFHNDSLYIIYINVLAEDYTKIAADHTILIDDRLISKYKYVTPY